MTTYNYPPSADTMILSAVPTTNYGSNVALHTGSVNGSEKRRSLLRWNISGLSGEQVDTDGTLGIYLNYDGASASQNLKAYLVRAARDWVDLQATWNIFKTSNNWGTAGCDNTSTDRYATEIASLALGASPAINQYYTWTIPKATIQDWIDNPSNNQGIVLISDAEAGVTYLAWNSNDAANNKPYLTFDHSTPVAGSKFLPFF